MLGTSKLAVQKYMSFKHEIQTPEASTNMYYNNNWNTRVHSITNCIFDCRKNKRFYPNALMMNKWLQRYTVYKEKNNEPLKTECDLGLETQAKACSAHCPHRRNICVKMNRLARLSWPWPGRMWWTLTSIEILHETSICLHSYQYRQFPHWRSTYPCQDLSPRRSSTVWLQCPHHI